MPAVSAFVSRGPDAFIDAGIDAGELLSVFVQRLDDVVLMIHVAGEVDMLTGPLLQDQLREVLATRPQQLIIDLSQAPFMGSTALSVLISARHATARRGITLQLRGTHRRAVAVPADRRGRPLVRDRPSQIMIAVCVPRATGLVVPHTQTAIMVVRCGKP